MYLSRTPRYVNFARFVLILLISTLSAAPALSGITEAQAWMTAAGYVPPTRDRIVACHGYGCTRRAALAIDPAWFTAVSAAMKAGRASPSAERKALGTAIRIYTANVSRQLGGEPDAPKSPPSLSGTHGQMDCLDVSANTTSLLLVLKERGLMVHHDIEGPVSRGVFLDGRYPHTSAAISEAASGTAWVVDPWGQAPGATPAIVPLEQWRQEG